MPDLTFSEDDYKRIEEAARLRGSKTPESYIVEVVKADLDARDDQAFFTPEILAEIDAAAAEADTAGGKTMDQIREHFSKKREAWLRDRSA